MKAIIPSAILVVLLLSALSVSVMFGGAETIHPGRIIEILSTPPADAQTSPDWVILVEIRIPRALCGALVGASLALSGVLLQGLFRNPLASPGILGATAGGAFAAVVALTLGFGVTSVLWVPAFSFAGTLFAVFTVYLLSIERQHVETTHLILCGVAVNTIFAAGTSLVLTLAIEERFDVGRQIVHWLAGGLNRASWDYVPTLLGALAISVAGSTVLARDLNLLLAGEESAQTLGARLDILKRGVLFLSALATGAAVAVAGMVSFVGLVVPHILRLILGPDHRQLLINAPLGGAVLLVLADLLAVRLTWPKYIPVGIITSLVGGPFFLFLLVQHRMRRRGG